MMGEYFGGGYGYLGGFGFIFMFIFWGLILWAVIAGIRMITVGHNHSCCGGHAREDGATKILRERYAKGEITEEQFRQMEETLDVKE